MAITVFKVFVWFLCIFEITDCQTIRVTSGKEMSAMVSRFCPHFIAAEVDDASLLLWSDLYFNQLVIPGANHLSQNVQPDYSGANLTFSFVMESQDVMLVATREDEIITRIFHIVVDKASGPIQVTTSSGDIQQVDYSMGDEVDITCAVSTCRRMAYTVQVVGPNNRTLRTWNGIFDQGVNNFTLGMAVSPDYAGQYKCTVKATLNGHAFALSSAASITGAPQAEPNTIPSTSSGVDTSYGGVSTAAGSLAKRHCPSSFLVLVLSMCVLVFCRFISQKDYIV